ncbi:MAG: thioredoxin domain-containing protein [Calditerrivibrio sp.]|uniref:thioredoxin domain-containing protein n=1 Tax=Calditerrivibrio sp. TaxID=2792612 RepID=UPI003D0DCBFB
MKKVLNSLKDENSQYLLQHSDNPVKWISWGSYLKIRDSIDKPLFISIGYSSCHWCHVMADESFSDEGIAAFLNDNFIPIKIDREEYPDLDKKYQFFAQITGSKGGWPLTVFADLDGSPFYAGTYFPKDDGYGIPSLMRILDSISNLYKNSNENIKKTTENYRNFIAKFYDSKNLEYRETDFNVFKDLFDYENGGLKGSTKFPNIPVMEYLLYHIDDNDVLKFLVKTADALCLSGICDQIDGGFFRYTVDGDWNIPHFEKMLYDNALNISFLSKLYEKTENELYLLTAKKTADFCIEFFDTEYGFGASYDADSYDENGNKKEGYFYTLTEESFYDLTVDEAKLLSEHCYFNNNHIRINNSLSLDTFKRLQPIFSKISNRRSNIKKRPNFDNKVIFSWNCLMINALLDFYEVSSDEFYFNKAVDSYFKIFHAMYTGDEINRISYQGKLLKHSVLEDYVYFLSSTNKIFSITKDKNFLNIGKKILLDILEKFYSKNILWYNKNNDVVDIFDDATPSSFGLFLKESEMLGHYIDLNLNFDEFVEFAKKFHSNYPFATPSLAIFLEKNYIS